MGRRKGSAPLSEWDEGRHLASSSSAGSSVRAGSSLCG